MAQDVSDFQKDVIERSRELPVLVDFWAAWCGPCRILGPVLEKLAEQAGGRWALAKVDTETFPAEAAQYGVMSIPNVLLFVDGEVVDGFVGALPEPHVRRWLERAIPSPHVRALAEARERLTSGDFEGAEAAVREVLAVAPGDLDARLLLAEVLIHRDPDAAAALATELENEMDDPDRPAALKTLAGVASLTEHPERLPEGAARARFLEAARAIRAGIYDVAMEAIIDVLKEDRRYADGIVRETGRAIFILLGLEHPVTARFHRQFASLLNV